MLTIRTSYTPDDLPRLYEIEKTCFTRCFRWSKEDFVTALKTDDIWIAEYGGQIAGFIIGEVEGNIGHVVTVDVDPSFRRRGFGEALMGAAENHYRKKGIKKMSLEVHVDNPAQILYFKLGYRVAGVREKYYANGSMGITMVKPLKKEKV